MIWVFGSYFFGTVLGIFCITFYFIQKMKNARIRSITAFVFLSLCFLALTFIYDNDSTCGCEKRTLETICNCIQDGVPREKILEQLDLSIQNQNPRENHKTFSMKVWMKMDELYWKRQSELEASLKERNLESLNFTN